MLSKKIPVWVYAVAFFIVASSYVRLYFGVDITDESQYVAQAWAYVLDGWSLFDSDLLIQGTPGVLIAPILYIWHKFF
ncbi:hypothetical protein, partial [Escherichia coli]|uniref:hypothetical protein n=1 Tax=Escherichia coli TaxID=562 RepID=UPI003891542F